MCLILLFHLLPVPLLSAYKNENNTSQTYLRLLVSDRSTGQLNGITSTNHLFTHYPVSDSGNISIGVGFGWREQCITCGKCILSKLPEKFCYSYLDQNNSCTRQVSQYINGMSHENEYLFKGTKLEILNCNS